jgi:S1-C subfamily serine protease
MSAQQGDLNDQFAKAAKEAAKKVGPSIVQIQTQGGTDMVVTSPKGPVFRKALGPTTGVVVDPDGYIITSAFNFLNSPVTIIVSIPGQPEPLLAKKVATDKSRMLTLLKVDKTGLPVPEWVPNKDLHVGQSAFALGRTLDLKIETAKGEHLPSVSHGIISALHRIWGKAIQTDAKTSPINYGGPLVDIGGRVQGIIIPASPQGDDVAAGFEWYDSGIGFAIPMEDVMAVLPRLRQGKDLEKGTLGVKIKGQDKFGALPELVAVQPDSAADLAGLKVGDVITAIDGKPVINQVQILHLLGPKYEGDVISLKYRRGKEEKTAEAVKLIAVARALYQNSYLGILPMRDDPKLGVEVRYVFAKSPAETAGIKAGDRIVQYGKSKTALKGFKGTKRGRDELADFLDEMAPRTEIALAIVPKEGKAGDPIAVKLEAMPGSSVITANDVVPVKLPAVASLKKALEPLEAGKVSDKIEPGKGPTIIEAGKAMEKIKAGKAPEKKDPVDQEPKKVETGLLKRTSASGDRRYWIYVPKDYNPRISHGLVVWLHTPGKFSDETSEKTTDLWEEVCNDNNLILVGPLTEQEGGWTPSDSDLVLEAVRDAMSEYTIDKNRVIAHGMGNGGQMAFNLVFRARDLFRGAAVVGAIMNEPQDNVAGQRLSFYIAVGGRDPVVKAVAETRQRLVARRFPVFYREFSDRGREYLDDEAFLELSRWIDVLDRL